MIGNVSPHNFGEAASDFDPPNPLIIYDSTIRKIIYTPGRKPAVDNLLRVGDALAKANIREIVLNVNWWGDTAPNAYEFAACRAFLAQGFPFGISVFSDSFIATTDYGNNGVCIAPHEAISVLGEIGMSTMVAAFTYSERDPDGVRVSEMASEAFSYATKHGNNDGRRTRRLWTNAVRVPRG